MKEKQNIHIIGIGGIGTSALARWFLANNYKVSGSDICESEITEDLKKIGVSIYVGHKTSNLNRKTILVIHSAAISGENPEIKIAKKLKIDIKSYSQTIGRIIKKYPKTIAVAGAHGKSTTASLLSVILIKAKLNPTVIIGTKLKEFGGNGGNFRNGKSDYLILEADEYHKSFLNYRPFGAIITNIDREHLDFYKNFGNIKNAFLKFISNIKTGGILILNKDDKNLRSLKEKINNPVKLKKMTIKRYSLADAHPILIKKISSSLKIFGKHNISNALAVYEMSKALGIEEKTIFAGLKEYNGAWRRMEYRGNLSLNTKYRIPVYDDYAHHPTEIKATLEAFRKEFPKNYIICVFQPHQEKRLKLLFKEFTAAFNDADALILLDIHKVAGRELNKLSQNINSKILAETIKKRSPLINVVYLPSPQKLPKILSDMCQSAPSSHKSALVVMMGAGNIYKYTNNLVK